jgi:hypothetical protein
MSELLRVCTGIDPDNEEIRQSVVAAVGDLQTTILRQVIYLRDSEVRRALVALGWTPPVK